MVLSKNAILDAHPFFSGINAPVLSLDILAGDPRLDLLASNLSCASRVAKIYFQCYCNYIYFLDKVSEYTPIKLNI